MKWSILIVALKVGILAMEISTAFSLILILILLNPLNIVFKGFLRKKEMLNSFTYFRFYFGHKAASNWFWFLVPYSFMFSN